MKLDKFHYHELMDRTHIVLELIEYQLYSHPGTTKKMKKKLRKAQRLLGDVYGMACAKEEKLS